MIKKLYSSIILLIAAIVTVCIIIGGTIVLNLPENPTHKFIVTKEFTGRVEAYYEQPGYPALKKEGNTFVYVVPPSGVITTSSKNASGTMVLNYVEQDGRLIEFPTDVPMIHGQDTSGGPEYSSKFTFFVGTEEQWIEAKKKTTATATN